MSLRSNKKERERKKAKHRHSPFPHVNYTKLGEQAKSNREQRLQDAAEKAQIELQKKELAEKKQKDALSRESVRRRAQHLRREDYPTQIAYELDVSRAVCRIPTTRSNKPYQSDQTTAKKKNNRIRKEYSANDDNSTQNTNTSSESDRATKSSPSAAKSANFVNSPNPLAWLEKVTSETSRKFVNLVNHLNCFGR